LNRLDAIVEFTTLDEARLLQVVEKFVGELGEQLKKKKVTLKVSPAAIKWLFQKGHQPEYGARPFARIVDEHLKKALVDDILFGAVSKGGTVMVDVKDQKLDFQFTSRK
jgi:ATP-dependent Clp protease ATP-binding subunit ClpA